ncbi:MAG: hypothetical protein AB7F89_28195, partial [Pirellulaceae bacterium]
AEEFKLQARQITFGPRHHFFGYIGHVQNTPWNQSGRYLVALRTQAQDHLPRPDEAADIVLLDAHHDYAQRVIDRTHAWNPQQGTMLYWNPAAPESQLIFNDRDPATGRVFAVLLDLAGPAPRRQREFRFDDVPVGNGGVCQTGGWFAAINYGRIARLRAVTGYKEALDPTAAEKHPSHDGVFRVDLTTGRRTLLVSFRQLAQAIRPRHPEIDEVDLFINHTLVNRTGDRVFFFVRGNYDQRGPRINVPMLIDSDGTNLQPLGEYLGGHPEWAEDRRLIGSWNKQQVVYDTDTRTITERIGDASIIPNPEGDVALSPDGTWLVNGYRVQNANRYVFVRRRDGVAVVSPDFDITGWTSGDLRCDPAPCWRRDGRAIAFPAIASDAEKTRQMFVLQLTP